MNLGQISDKFLKIVQESFGFSISNLKLVQMIYFRVKFSELICLLV